MKVSCRPAQVLKPFMNLFNRKVLNICSAFGFAQVVSYFFIGCDGHGIFETIFVGKVHFKNLQLILHQFLTVEAVQEMALTKMKVINFLSR